MIGKPEKILSASFLIAIGIMTLGWGNPVALLIALAIGMVSGAWYGVEKARLWTVENNHA